jgi:phytoene dehydrogenase-like protein
VPATLRCIAALEQYQGAWYINGGLPKLGSELVKLATDVGVKFETSSSVDHVVASTQEVEAVVVNGTKRQFTTVIANIDAEILYSSLLPTPTRLRSLRKAQRSSAAFVLLVGVRGRTPNLSHHNIVFSESYDLEFADIFKRNMAPQDPTLYVCCSGVTDSSQTRAGHENWTVLANVPSGAHIDEDTYTKQILGLLEQRLGLTADRIVFCEARSPQWYESATRSTGGSIYGTSSNGRFASFLRPDTRGPVRGLYLCGGSAHPGGGLPMVARSGRLAVTALLEDSASLS